MRLIPTDKIREGMIVTKTIFGSNGTVLIGKGMVIKNGYKEKLMEMGVPYIYIDDSMCSQEILDDIIRDETRNEAMLIVEEVMEKAIFSEIIKIEKIKKIVDKIIKELLQNEDILISLMEIRAVDRYTFGHNVNVCIMSIVTGISLGYSQEELMNLGIGAILHDIGKSKIPSEILNKPDKLTYEEYEEVKKHTIFGYEILKLNMKLDESACNIALLHHERFDGKGYPYGLSGDELHDFVKIVSVVDVYDALTSDRVYKEKIDRHKAAEYLISMCGQQFDYSIVETFIKNIGIYPIGIGILLSTGEKGYVVDIKKEAPSRPVVLVTDSNINNNTFKPYELNLMKNSSISIVDTVEYI